MKKQEAQPVPARLLTIKQAAQYLSCPIWTLRDLEWRSELPSVRNLGRALKFDRSDLDKLVEQRKGRTQ